MIAKELANEKIVGWFQGKMEFGPRALGGRSILADPRSEKMQKELNLKIIEKEEEPPRESPKQFLVRISITIS